MQNISICGLNPFLIILPFRLQKWKQGKRKAEKDELQGGQWFVTVHVPHARLDATDT